ncbi:hypothetical protein BUALT_Bualt11G0042900 [Buddleja alternifolia]|uniref:HTH La-type RNA-binding domain-containing protein n=1 Tax=Buddleja alternifolia TaxID=168488 RepID=A0AAV6WYS6_9LAMI|nr:hypothetical protein BUALT_Bualt11G0042900 [Buddleja alternifolia]
MEDTFSYLSEDCVAGVDTQLDSSSSDNGGTSKKPAWSKPSNGGATPDVVMGAESWPALSESARASPKPSTDSPKSLSHGSPTASQGMEVGSLSLQKEVNTIISTPNSTANHVAPTRQRSIKRGSGSSSQSSIPANGGLSQAPPMQGVVVEAPHPNQGKSSGSAGEFSKDNMHKDAGQRGGYSSYRRSNSGSQPRGDGAYHGGRRDQERGKQDWGNNPNRNFGNREGHAPQQRVNSRAFMRGPAPNAPFIPSPLHHVALRPYGTPMVYAEVPAPVYYGHPDSLRPMPMFPYSPMYFPMPDPQLPSKIVNQIDYYFSNENLVKDTFLRQNMDVEGWVSIKLIAGFKKGRLTAKLSPLLLFIVNTASETFTYRGGGGDLMTFAASSCCHWNDFSVIVFGLHHLSNPLNIGGHLWHKRSAPPDFSSLQCFFFPIILFLLPCHRDSSSLLDHHIKSEVALLYVMQLTDNIQLILDAIQASNVVEVQGDKVRRKGDWNKWIMTPFHSTVRSSQDMLAAHVNSIKLDDKAAT